MMTRAPNASPVFDTPRLPPEQVPMGIARFRPSNPAKLTFCPICVFPVCGGRTGGLQCRGHELVEDCPAAAGGGASSSAEKIPGVRHPAHADKYYRVQVGPYQDNQTASNARKDLEAKGFKSIIKR